MAIDTVPKATDVRLSEDWRAGVVELPADHVFGATKLDDLSWQKLDEKRHGQFVVEERPTNWRPGDPPLTRHYYHQVPDHRSAWDLVHERLGRVEKRERAFGPDGCYRIVVTEVFR